MPPISPNVAIRRSITVNRAAPRRLRTTPTTVTAAPKPSQAPRDQLIPIARLINTALIKANHCSQRVRNAVRNWTRDSAGRGAVGAVRSNSESPGRRARFTRQFLRCSLFDPSFSHCLHLRIGFQVGAPGRTLCGTTAGTHQQHIFSIRHVKQRHLTKRTRLRTSNAQQQAGDHERKPQAAATDFQQRSVDPGGQPHRNGRYPRHRDNPTECPPDRIGSVRQAVQLNR